jgi:hypothetical protein
VVNEEAGRAKTKVELGDGSSPKPEIGFSCAMRLAAMTMLFTG